MDRGANSDMCFLQDEKFDFDVSLSPVSAKEEEEEDDEVFVDHTEQCVSTDLSSQPEEGGGGVQAVWTPLTADQLEAVCEEAHKLASQLQCGEPLFQNTNTTHTASDADTNSVAATEEFIQDTEVKTFCVQDSPLRQLPPAVQHRLLRGSSSSRVSSSCPAARLITSSPMVGARPQARPALRGKAALRAATALPSKPVAPAGSCSASSSGAEKTRLQPPSRTAGVLKRSPSCGLRNKAESSEDLLSDSVSVASDNSDCSFNSSMLGKRSLAPPSKSAGLRKLSGIKAPPVQGWKVTDRRKTSSSSSSLSNLNSSMSQSPATGKLNSSLNRSVSNSSGPAEAPSREPGLSRPRRSTLSASTELLSSRTGSRSQPTQAKKPPDAERAKAARSTPLKRAESTPVQPTPPKRTGSVGATGSDRLHSGMKTRSKPGGLVHPTPNMANKGVHAEGVSKVMKPKRLSTSSTVSRPQKLSAGSLTPSVGSSKPQQVAARRPSALPTPVKRRTSTFQTPSNQNRTLRPPFRSDSSISLTLSSAEKQQRCSPVPKGKQEEEPVYCPDIQVFCLEEEESPFTLPSISPETKQTQNMDLGESTISETVPNPVEPEEMEDSAAQEVLLLDLPPPSLQPQEKLLIDLANTPDLIRTSSKSCTTTQLIDLSSPLIKWSPEDKKENSAPLINLSF
uniref:G2 and S-phase expressed 1 n=1 Tax=Poecilia reticulata TaxID=8081 RepID=A0A3P9N1I3_POERE